jgi:hypothetical protein
VILNPVPTELTTAATDALLALLSAGGDRWLRGRLAADPARASHWSLVFRLLAAASALGVLAHGLALSTAAREAFWHPLYLLLGLVVAAFLIAAVHDLLGEQAARRARWPLLALGVAFFVVTKALGGSFLIFVIYEGVAMLAALAAYAWLALRGRLAGAAAIALGIVLDLAAAGVQASSLSVTLGVPLDHNGLFHVVQLAALAAMLAGIGAGRPVTASGSP